MVLGGTGAGEVELRGSIIVEDGCGAGESAGEKVELRPQQGGTVPLGSGAEGKVEEELGLVRLIRGRPTKPPPDLPGGVGKGHGPGEDLEDEPDEVVCSERLVERGLPRYRPVVDGHGECVEKVEDPLGITLAVDGIERHLEEFGRMFAEGRGSEADIRPGLGLVDLADQRHLVGVDTKEPLREPGSGPRARLGICDGGAGADADDFV